MPDHQKRYEGDIHGSFRYQTPAIVLAALALTACGGGSDNSIAEDDADSVSRFSEQLMPAATETVYLNLETGAMVEESDDWHIAANRLNFRVNSGASGNGSVVGALAIAQDDFYDSNGDPDANVFTNATANSEEEHLLGILEAPGAGRRMPSPVRLDLQIPGLNTILPQV